MKFRVLLVTVLMCILCTTQVFAQKKPVVYILATGGTIAGASASSTDTLAYKAAVTGVEQLIANVPQLKDVADVRGEQIAQIISGDMNNEMWLKIAKRVNELLAQKDVAGVVITHGTDTMEETAFFLNLVVKSNKPVVLVGSMRPGTAISADGPLNILNAVTIAASPQAKNYGVMVLMNDTIHGARDVRKTNTSLVNSFGNDDFGAMGYIMNGKIDIYRQSTKPHTVNTEFDISKMTSLPRVDIVYAYSDSGASDAIKAFVNAGAKAIVYAGSGNGSIHEGKDLAPVLEAQSKGVVIVRSSRTMSGPVSIASYVGRNFIASNTLTPQKARILVMLALANGVTDPVKIQQIFDKY